MKSIHIDIDSGNIKILYDASLFKPRQLSQLYYWGFRKSTDADYCTAELDKTTSLLLKKVIEYFDSESIKYEFSSVCQSYIDSLIRSANDFEITCLQGKNFKNGLIDKRVFSAFADFVKNRIVRNLKEHQIKAAYHLYLVQNGANFSVPGSGKTAVILTVYEKLRTEGKVNSLFVVGPPACFGPWRQEFEDTLGRKPDFRILAGGDQVTRKSEYFKPIQEKGELYLTTFQTLLNDLDDVIALLTQKSNKTFLVIDEAHYIKQVGGNWAKAVLRLAPHAHFKTVLTGTPFPRSYVDVFNLFDYLWPANSPLDSSTKTRIEVLEKKNDAKTVREIFDKSVGPLIYRVRKKDVGLMPPKFHDAIKIQMNANERRLYDAIVTKVRSYPKDNYMKNIELVKKLRRGRIIRLRQCVSYSRLLNTVVDSYDEDLISDEADLANIIRNYDKKETPAKIEYLSTMLREFNQSRQKVVIWANFIDTLKLIKKTLANTGINSELIYGDTPTETTAFSDEKTREKIRDAFVAVDSGLDVLIANPAACAESISLHKTCFHAIYYDLSYNCAQYLQSLDRIHRVGGSENNQANYYFLQYENTIDQDIKNNLDKKAQKMYEIIDQDFDIYSLDMFGEEDDLQAYDRLFGGN